MVPSRRALLLVAAWLPLAGAAAVFADLTLLLWVWAGSGTVLVLLLGLDAVRGLASPELQLERQLLATLPLGVWSDAAIRVVNAGRRAKQVVVLESEPASCRIRHLPRLLRVAAGGWAEVPYGVCPTARGVLRFGELTVQVGSPLGLWWRTFRQVGSGKELRVYPNFRAVARYALLATSDRTAALGIRKLRRRGEGTEFHQLREYRVGDPLRQIDWRATSRLMKAISRDYRDERDQQVLFLLDCGRRMHAQDGTLTHLDHALDAVLLLAYVALRQGDAVGLSTFGGTERKLPPRKGASYLNVLVDSVFDLRTSSAASDPSEALKQALDGLRRRTLIVLVSNQRDEEDEELIALLKLASRRHLVLLASLREEALDRALAEQPVTFELALLSAATREYLRARKEAHDRLSRAGVLYLDVAPRDLAVSLVNRYLRIKASGQL